MSRARGPVCGPWPCLLVLAAFAAAPSEALAAPKHAAPGTQIAQAKQVKKTASAARPEHKAAAPVDAKKVEAKPTEAKTAMELSRYETALLGPADLVIRRASRASCRRPQRDASPRTRRERRRAAVTRWRTAAFPSRDGFDTHGGVGRPFSDNRAYRVMIPSFRYEADAASVRAWLTTAC